MDLEEKLELKLVSKSELSLKLVTESQELTSDQLSELVDIPKFELLNKLPEG